MSELAHLEPKIVWKAFEEISRIPRCSKCEAEILDFIKEKAEARGLAHRSDEAGNLLVELPPKGGKSLTPGLVIQGHVDMVCEANRGVQHDFSKDPIRLQIDGEWIRAEGTTLGADNGIALAYMLALMEGDFRHGPIELLFTVDEETGLTGATKLDPSMIKYRTLLNIDSDEEGIFYIGCAGGKETIGTRKVQRIENWRVPSYLPVEVAVQGLRGGHSGSDIHLEPANSLLLMGRLLAALTRGIDLKIVDIQGGDKHNAIPREAFCRLWCPAEALGDLQRILAEFRSRIGSELHEEDGGLKVEVKELAEPPGAPLVEEDQRRLLALLQVLPHGIQAWSRSIPGLVSTSSNLAALRLEGEEFKVLTSQRSDTPSLLEMIADRTAASMESCGFVPQFSREYPSWQPDPSSRLLATCLEVFEEVQGRKAVYSSIHAGLECGIIGGKIPGMEMVSFGPDIEALHTPSERTRIESVARIWEFLLALLERI